MGKNRINWTEVEKEFLSNPLTSLKDVAERFSISYGVVRRMAMRQGWYPKKKIIREKLEKTAFDEVMRLVTEKVRQDARKTGSAPTGRQQIGRGVVTDATQ